MQLYALQDKLSLLLKSYKALQEREATLQKKVASLEAKVEGLSLNVLQLEEALMAKKMGSHSDSEALKMYIDAIIEEIEIAIKSL